MRAVYKDKIPVSMIDTAGTLPGGWVAAAMPPYDDTLCAFADWVKKN